MKKYVMPITENVELLSGNICQATSPVSEIYPGGAPCEAPGRLTYAD